MASNDPSTFDLLVKDARGSGEAPMRVSRTMTVGALKQLLERGEQCKVHVAFHGRLLKNEETLEAAGVPEAPVVVIARILAPSAPQPSSPAGVAGGGESSSHHTSSARQHTAKPSSLAPPPPPALSPSAALVSAAQAKRRC